MTLKQAFPVMIYSISFTILVVLLNIFNHIYTGQMDRHNLMPHVPTWSILSLGLTIPDPKVTHSGYKWAHQVPKWTL